MIDILVFAAFTVSLFEHRSDFLSQYLVQLSRTTISILLDSFLYSLDYLESGFYTDIRSDKHLLKFIEYVIVYLMLAKNNLAQFLEQTLLGSGKSLIKVLLLVLIFLLPNSPKNAIRYRI